MQLNLCRVRPHPCDSKSDPVAGEQDGTGSQRLMEPSSSAETISRRPSRFLVCLLSCSAARIRRVRLRMAEISFGCFQHYISFYHYRSSGEIVGLYSSFQYLSPRWHQSSITFPGRRQKYQKSYLIIAPPSHKSSVLTFF